MRIDFTAKVSPQLLRYLRPLLKRAAPLLGKSAAVKSLQHVSFVLVGDAMMSKLHMDFMNIPGPTDVLTFPIDVNDAGQVTSGEIIVCVPEARRRAADFHGDTAREVLLYCIHGLLHLCGYDDRTKIDYNKMHRKEDRILTQLGVGKTFALPTARPNRQAKKKKRN